MQTSTLQEWIGAKIVRSSASYSRSDLEAWQLERLQYTIGYVGKNSPFYRKLFEPYPDALTSLEQLAQYPFTTAQDILADPARLVCVGQEEVQRIVTLPTSGTSGPSKRVYFTAEDQELTIDFFKVGMANLASVDDRVLILLPGERPGSVGDLLQIGLERLGCLALKNGPVDDEERVLRLMSDQRVNVLVGAPVDLHRLARWDEHFHLLLPGQMKSVLSSTDTLPLVIRANLQRIWGCKVFDHYGMTETGLGGGVECGAHRGYHLREADLLYEVIDPESGEHLPDGETGEVVVTTLTRAAMPLVRYRTGDLSRFYTDECPCGSFIRRLESIRGRVNAGIHNGECELRQVDLDEALFQLPQVLDFTAGVSEDKGKKVLEIALEQAPGGSGGLSQQVMDALIAIPGIGTQISMEELLVRISSMTRCADSRPGYMRKRVLVNGR